MVNYLFFHCSVEEMMVDEDLDVENADENAVNAGENVVVNADENVVVNADENVVVNAGENVVNDDENDAESVVSDESDVLIAADEFQGWLLSRRDSGYESEYFSDENLFVDDVDHVANDVYPVINVEAQDDGGVHLMGFDVLNMFVHDNAGEAVMNVNVRAMHGELPVVNVMAVAHDVIELSDDDEEDVIEVSDDDDVIVLSDDSVVDVSDDSDDDDVVFVAAKRRRMM